MGQNGIPVGAKWTMLTNFKQNTKKNIRAFVRHWRVEQNGTADGKKDFFLMRFKRNTKKNVLAKNSSKNVSPKNPAAVSLVVYRISVNSTENSLSPGPYCPAQRNRTPAAKWIISIKFRYPKKCSRGQNGF